MSEVILAVITGTQALLFALTFRSERRAARHRADAAGETNIAVIAAAAAANAKSEARAAAERTRRLVEQFTRERSGRWAGEPNAVDQPAA